MTKIKLSPILPKFIKSLIYQALAGDEELQQYLPNPKETLEQTVERVNNCINDLYGSQVYAGSKIRSYGITLVEEAEGVRHYTTIGFTILIINPETPHELYSFGINHKYRKKEIVLAWLEKINETLGGLYYLGLHKENTRAINFFIKNGFTKDEETRNFVLLFNNFNEIVKQKEKSFTNAS